MWLNGDSDAISKKRDSDGLNRKVHKEIFDFCFNYGLICESHSFETIIRKGRAVAVVADVLLNQRHLHHSALSLHFRGVLVCVCACLTNICLSILYNCVQMASKARAY